MPVKPRFAVCLAAHNGMEFIATQIESILAQTECDLRIFINVDLSTDGTEAYLSEWASSEPRLTLLPLGQRFGAAAPNFYRLLREVDLSSFDYLSFADQDDIWHPQKLWRAHCLMLEKNAKGYSSNVTAFWPDGHEVLVKKAFPQREFDYLFESAGPGCTYVLESGLASQLQKIIRDADDSIFRIDYHDWLAYAFARAHKFKWVIDDWPSMAYRQHGKNQIGVNAGWKSFWLRLRKVLNGYGFEQSLLIADLIQVSTMTVVRRGLRGGCTGYVWLSSRANQCRRRRIDKFLFFISCLILAVIKPLG